MSGYVDNIKNPGLKAHLDHMRLLNKQRISICKYCSNKAIGIVAEGYSLYPACSQHIDNTPSNRQI